jgi:hypothetical protein
MSGSDYTTTPNLGLFKPTYDADDEQWGTHLNANADVLDAAFAPTGGLFLPIAGGTMTGAVTLAGVSTAPTAVAGTNTTQIASTAFVTAALASAGGVTSFNTRAGVVTLNSADVTTVLPPSSTTPAMNGTAAVGASGKWADGVHVHPTDTTRAPLASPVFTGDPQAPTPAAGDSDTSVATTAFVQTAVAPAQHNVGRNLLHNSLLNIAQRGAGPFGTNGNYTLDRWQLQTSGDTGVTVIQAAIPDAARTQIGDEAATYVLSLSTTGNAAAGAYTEITQSIEGVRRLAGKTITLSFWAVAGAAGLKVGLNGYSLYGTGGSPSAPASWQVTGTAITLATTWARYSVTFAVPSSSGKTLGTNAGTDQNTLQIWLSSGATNNAQAGNIGVQSGTIQIWGVQLEIGSVATPLEKPDPRYDLSNCQRFYQSTAGFQMGGTAAGVASLFVSTLVFPTTMRGTPTVTFSGTSYTNTNSLAVGGMNAQIAQLSVSSAAAGNAFCSTTVLASADL